MDTKNITFEPPSPLESIAMGFYETFHPSRINRYIPTDGSFRNQVIVYDADRNCDRPDYGYMTRFNIKIGGVATALGLVAAGIYYNITHDPEAPQKITMAMNLAMSTLGIITSAVTYVAAGVYALRNPVNGLNI